MSTCHDRKSTCTWLLVNQCLRRLQSYGISVKSTVFHIGKWLSGVTSHHGSGRRWISPSIDYFREVMTVRHIQVNILAHNIILIHFAWTCEGEEQKDINSRALFGFTEKKKEDIERRLETLRRRRFWIMHYALHVELAQSSPLYRSYFLSLYSPHCPWITYAGENEQKKEEQSVFWNGTSD